MKIPTIRDLEVTFKSFKQCTCDGVSGVLKIDSVNPGPVLGITACTHGNEPAGLAMFHHLLGEMDIHNSLLRGTLYLVVNNIAAAEKFFATTGDDKMKCRYINVNMNRLPPNTLAPDGDINLYEVRRAQELYPIWSRFDAALDVHSTTDYDLPFIVSKGGEFHADLVRGFTIQTLLTNIDTVQINRPAFSFYAMQNPTAAIFGIEAGQHEDPETFERAAVCVKSLLQNLGMLPGKPEVSVTEYTEYRIDGSVLFPNMSYDFVQAKHNPQDPVVMGQVLARSTLTGDEILAPFDGVLIMPDEKRGEKKDIKEEQSFISRPAQVRRVT